MTSRDTPHGGLLSELREAEAYYGSSIDPNLRQQSDLCKRAADALAEAEETIERKHQMIVAYTHELAVPSEAQHNIRDRILAERDKGNVVFWGLPDELMAANLEEFVKQPADGILYDLNRLEEVCLTFITDKKWVNDFAVAMVIRKLKEGK